MVIRVFLTFLQQGYQAPFYPSPLIFISSTSPSLTHPSPSTLPPPLSHSSLDMLLPPLSLSPSFLLYHAHPAPSLLAIVGQFSSFFSFIGLLLHRPSPSSSSSFLLVVLLFRRPFFLSVHQTILQSSSSSFFARPRRLLYFFHQTK